MPESCKSQNNEESGQSIIVNLSNNIPLLHSELVKAVSMTISESDCMKVDWFEGLHSDSQNDASSFENENIHCEKFSQILVVDDWNFNLFAVQTILNEQGFSCDTSMNG